jgi:hypothetical protein
MVSYQVAVVVVEGSYTLKNPTHVTMFDPAQANIWTQEYANWQDAFVAFLAAGWEPFSAGVAPGAWTFGFRKAVTVPDRVPDTAAPPIAPLGS